MHLRELLRFRRTNADVVPMDVLRSLGLSMPDDVLAQFVFDHGTKDHFQHQYGHLDLNAVRWKEFTLPASEILLCSVYPRFASWVECVADRTRVVPTKGWDGLCLPPTAADHWQQHGTWMRSPVMIRGRLIDLDRPLHLVEGHTRIGALRGLVEASVLPATSMHQVWIGEGFRPGKPDERWREVLQTERIPFLEWLMTRAADEGEIGKVAMRLIDIQYSSMSSMRVDGDDLDAILSFAKVDAILGQLIGTIERAHVEWRGVVGC